MTLNFFIFFQFLQDELISVKYKMFQRKVRCFSPFVCSIFFFHSIFIVYLDDSTAAVVAAAAEDEDAENNGLLFVKLLFFKK